MFRIKICGITSVDDALATARAGADAVGLNFYRNSPRYVAPDRARDIVDALPDWIVCVGLFVDAEATFVGDTFDRLGLDLIQLHGDEPPEFLAALQRRPVMRAFRLGQSGLAPVTAYLDKCRSLQCLPQMVLVDACVSGQYGGTGQVADWAALKGYSREPSFPPLVLAGGLTSQNVGEAIRSVRPLAVDTASGVESSPGRKDPAAVAAFVRTARAEFDALAY